MLRSRQRWVLGGAVGVMAALCAGFLTLPSATYQAETLEVVEMRDFDASEVERFRQRAVPVPVRQAVPARQDLPQEGGDEWDRTLDRADWIGGATVTCDLGALAGEAYAAHLQPDQGFRLEGSVDLMSRVHTGVEEGRITFAVTEPSGVVGVVLSDPIEPPTPEEARAPDGGSVDDDAQGWGPDRNRVIRVRWSGATPGSVVGCDGVWAPPSGTLRVRFRMPDGEAFDPEVHRIMPSLLRGCGVMWPIFSGGQEFTAEAGSCTLIAERRAQGLPLASALGPAKVVQIVPGGVTEVVLDLPEAPPIYAPPDLGEIAAAADIASFAGADAAADFLEELLEQVRRGEWSPERIQEALAELTAERMAEQGEPVDADDVVLEGELTMDPDALEDAGIDPDTVESIRATTTDDFADLVEEGSLSLDDLPESVRADVEAELDAR